MIINHHSPYLINKSPILWNRPDTASWTVHIYTMRHAIFDNMTHHQSRMTVNKSRGISKSLCVFFGAGITGSSHKIEHDKNDIDLNNRINIA